MGLLESFILALPDSEVYNTYAVVSPAPPNPGAGGDIARPAAPRPGCRTPPSRAADGVADCHGDVPSLRAGRPRSAAVGVSA